MTRHKLTKLILGLCVTVLALSACGSRETTPSPDQMRTYVAETISVQLTRTEIARPTATPTPTLAPTATMAPPDKDWRDCTAVLSRRDFAVLMTTAWSG